MPYMYKLLIGEYRELLFAHSTCNNLINDDIKRFMLYITQDRSCCNENQKIAFHELITSSTWGEVEYYTADSKPLETPFDIRNSALDYLIVCDCLRSCLNIMPDTFSFGFLFLEKVHQNEAWWEIGKITLSIELTLNTFFHAHGTSSKKKGLCYYKKKKLSAFHISYEPRK